MWVRGSISTCRRTWLCPSHHPAWQRRQQTFFCDEDYQCYPDLLAEWCRALLELAPSWRAFLARVLREEDLNLLRAHQRTGRPLGDEEFPATRENDLRRTLRRQRPGPKGTA